jgi:hypothetical protein
MPRDLFLRPVSCRHGGENEKTLGVLISDILARQLTTPPCVIRCKMKLICLLRMSINCLCNTYKQTADNDWNYRSLSIEILNLALCGGLAR